MINEIGRVISLNNTKKTLRLCIFAFSLLFFFVLIACGGKVAEDKLKTEVKKEIVPVDFQYEEVRRIKLDKPQFDNFKAMDFVNILKDRIYIMDYSSAKVKVIDMDGKYLFEFLSKGQGPRELEYISGNYNIDGNCYICGDRKTLKFDKDGKLLSSKKTHDYYKNFIPLNNSKFLGVDRRKVGEENEYFLGIFDFEENLICELGKSKNNGMVTVHVATSHISFGIQNGFVPRFFAKVDFKNNLIYFCDTEKYIIKYVSFEGKELGILKNNVKSFPITDKMVENVFKKISFPPSMKTEAKKQIKKQIRTHFTLVSDLMFSPKGLVIVRRPKGNGDALLDIFDKEGNLLSIYNVSKDFDIFDGYLFEDKYYKINETDDYYELMVYKLKNLPKGW